MSDNVIFAVLFFPAVVFVMVFGMKYLSAALQARARHAQDDTYSVLAKQVAQADTAAAVTAQGSVLADVQARLARLEKILTQVE